MPSDRLHVVDCGAFAFACLDLLLGFESRRRLRGAVVQQGIDKAAADTAACDAKFTTITNEHIAKTEAWQANADRRLDSAEIRLDEAEASLKTKATLEETKDLREKVRMRSPSLTVAG